MHKMFVDGGGQFKDTYFSYKVFNPQGKTIQHMDRFLLRNLSPELLPQSCSILDDKGLETNNIAEYAALHYGLLWFIENVGLKPVKIFQDSQLVVRQVYGQYRCHKTHLRPWLFAIQANQWPTMELVNVPREDIVKILGH
jgi:hypothetical protein